MSSGNQGDSSYSLRKRNALYKDTGGCYPLMLSDSGIAEEKEQRLATSKTSHQPCSTCGSEVDSCIRLISINRSMST